MADGDRSGGLKDALYESLSAILSPLHDVRVAAEEQIKILEVTEEFGVYLAQVTVHPQEPLSIRQLSSVLLKQYVEAHWSSHSDKYRPPETSEMAKAAIRSILPVGLKETISKVRSSVAYAVSAIARWDWPEVWPELFGILMEALTSSDSNAVHGAMRVLTEFSREVTDFHMPQVAPVILPEMYKVFTQSQVYSIRTRSRAVDIFNTCANMIGTMSQLNKTVAKQVLYPVLPQFTSAFIEGLQMPDGEFSDSGIKMEILKAITTLIKSFPKAMSASLPQILPQVWNTLTQSVDIYVRTVVNDTDEADDPVDSDGEVLGFENLVFGVFEFVHVLIDTPKFKYAVNKTLDQLIYYVILYMQITEEQVKSWTDSPDQFVEDEDDDTFSYSVRISAQDLLLSLASECEDECAPAIVFAISRHLQEAENHKLSGNLHWWKIHESVMLALGSVRSLIVDKITSNHIQFDVTAFLNSVVLADLDQHVSPFLLGRCLWTSSRFVEVTSPELMPRFLQATVSGLRPNQPASVQISAVRSVFGFCDHLKSSANTAVLMPYLPSSEGVIGILDGILSIAQQYSSEVLALCLESLCIVLTVDKTFTASVEEKVSPLAIAVFLKFSGDPLIVSLIQDVFKELSRNELCTITLQQRLVPSLISILQAQSGKVPDGLPSVSLDVIEMLVRSGSPPLSDLLMQAFPVVARVTLTTEDNACMQSGGECLRAYVSVGLQQILQWHDEQGNNGMYYVVQVVSRLLDPKTSEFTATFVGRLVTLVISRVGTKLGENLDLMLRAVLSKLQQAETLSVIQSLVLVFAHLMHVQMEAILDFLTSVPGPTGKCALEFVLEEWCSKQHLFYGAYENKISAIALCKLVQHTITTNDTRISGIMVKGEEIFGHNEGVRTRSKTAKEPGRWTSIPVIVKMYKLLINELNSQLETAMTQADFDDEDEDDWEDTDNGAQGQTLESLLSSLSPADYGDLNEQDDDDEDDPDVLGDPIYQTDLKVYLTEYLQSLAQQPCFAMLSAHLNDNERHVLVTIGINT